MFNLPHKLKRVVKQFSLLPGIGEKTAMRYALIMTKWNKENLQGFASALDQLDNLDCCKECGLFIDDECTICSDESREKTGSLCVVENISDCWAIEKSGQYKGVYHILGGVLSPLMGISPENLTMDKLLIRIRERKITEVILALNPSVEGDVTCSYLKEKIPLDVNLKRIGLGVPMGGNLEYLDSMTINKALENRRIF